MLIQILLWHLLPQLTMEIFTAGTVRRIPFDPDLSLEQIIRTHLPGLMGRIQGTEVHASTRAVYAPP